MQKPHRCLVSSLRSFQHSHRPSLCSGSCCPVDFSNPGQVWCLISFVVATLNNFMKNKAVPLDFWSLGDSGLRSPIWYRTSFWQDTLKSLMADDIDCQLNWIQKHLIDKILGMSVRDFLYVMIRSEVACFQCGWCHSLGQGSMAE